MPGADHSMRSLNTEPAKYGAPSNWRGTVLSLAPGTSASMAAAFSLTKSAKVEVPLKPRSGVSLTVVSWKKVVLLERANSRNSHLPLFERAISLVRSTRSALPLTAFGAALLSLKRRVTTSRAALYSSEGNGWLESPCHRFAQVDTSFAVVAGRLYSRITVNCWGKPDASLTPKTNRPSPADPALRFRRSTRLTMA